jgi:hypothetical protein
MIQLTLLISMSSFAALHTPFFYSNIYYWNMWTFTQVFHNEKDVSFTGSAGRRRHHLVVGISSV